MKVYKKKKKTYRLKNNRNDYSQRRRKKKLNKKKKFILIILFVLLSIVLLFSMINIIKWLIDNYNNKHVIEEATKEVEITEVEDNENTEIINPEEDKNSDYWYFINFPLTNVDFSELILKNNDTVGWLNVNNTNINYPVVQGSDNEYYLRHSFDGSYNEAGWVYLDFRNDGKFTDKNNIIYAHSRLDKTMFGSLNDTLYYSWYSNRDNYIIRMSSATENTMWQIFSVYTIEAESYYITVDFSSSEKFQEYLDTVKGRSIHNFNTTITSDDRILTLSTCYSDTKRTVIHAKLIKKEPR